ncbi:hypothetical protein P7K49_019110, partial [Saguinus oedipus]
NQKEEKTERGNETVPSKLDIGCNLMGRSDSRNSRMGIDASPMHSVEAFGIFSKHCPHLPPESFMTSVAGKKVQTGQVSGDLLSPHSALPYSHPRPYHQ